MLKKQTTYIMALVFSFALIFGMIPFAVVSASGNSETYKLIKNYDELNAFANEVKEGNSYEGKTVMLADSFQSNSGILKKAIGIYSWDDNANKFNGKAFKGTFNGNGKTVQLDISQNDTDGIGMFACTAGSVTIKNLSVSGKVSGDHMVGGIVGYANTGVSLKLINCSNFSTVTGNTGAGGLVGYANIDASLTNCSNSGTVSSDYGAGGLIGFCAIESDLYITNCYSSGKISSKDYVGGLAGHVSELIVIQNGFYINTNTTGIGSVSDSITRATAMSAYDMKDSSKLLAKLNEYVINNSNMAYNDNAEPLCKWVRSDNTNNGYPILGTVSKKTSQNNTNTTKKNKLNITKSTQKIKLIKKKYVAKKNTVKINVKAKTKLSFKALKKNKYYKISKQGKIIFTKSAKKGIYKIKVKITAKANTKYKKAVATKLVIVKLT